ncbi:MAG: mechanosensitive ion channel family protein [Clostridia bacterium]|nr:mechanosensitive ion channel family protein [Clostridia bacterium]
MEELLKQLLQTLFEISKTIGLRLFFALLLLFVGLKLARTFSKKIKNGRGMQRIDKNVASFLNSLIKILLYAAVLIGCLLILGVPAASFVTAIASCGLAIGLALQGSLGNFAGGIMLLIFKPFQIGDFIEGAGYSGTVEDITILYTHIITPDNLKVSLPNGKLSDDAVINYTALGKRRADISVSVPYECDLKTVRAILLKVAEENPYRLKDDPITVEIIDYADSGIKMCVRYYANNDVFWTAVFKTRQDILDIFKENGISIPYNRIDVSHIQQNENNQK